MSCPAAPRGILRTLFVVIVATASVQFIGCSHPYYDPPRPILPSSVIDEPPGPGDGGIDPAGNPGATKSVVITAAPVFCCNALSLHLGAELMNATPGIPVSYDWKFGDGHKASGARPNHTFPWPGEFTVEVRARESTGAIYIGITKLSLNINGQGAAEVLVEPQDPPSGPGGDGGVAGGAGGQPFTADAGPDQQLAPNTHATLAGGYNASIDINNVTFQWTQILGPEVQLSGANQPTAEFTTPALDVGVVSLRFRLTATSGEQSDTDFVDIYVSPDFNPGQNTATTVTLGLQSLATAEGEALPITLQAHVSPETVMLGNDAPQIEYAVVDPPNHGSLGPVLMVSQTVSLIVYTPFGGFTGSDQFKVRANVLDVQSEPATISIAVGDVPSQAAVGNGSAYLVPVNRTVLLTLQASLSGPPVAGDAGVQAEFLIDQPPAHGTLGAVQPSDLMQAVVTYAPNHGFHGNDQLRFRVRRGVNVSEPATVALKVFPTCIPWLEMNTVNTPSLSVYSAAEGAEPGMSLLDFTVQGLNRWALVTDAAIITTAPGYIQLAYDQLMEARPANMQIIGGIKTYTIPGAQDIDPRPWNFTDAASWLFIADEVAEIAERTNNNLVVLENETALKPYVQQGQTSGVNLDALPNCLSPLQETGVETLWWMPRVSSNTTNFPDREVQSTAFVTEIVDNLDEVSFITDYMAWDGWESSISSSQRRDHMIDIVGEQHNFDMMYVTADGWWHYTTTQIRCFTAAEAIAEIEQFNNVERVIIYTGGASWQTVSNGFASLLPPMAPVVGP